MLWTARKLWHEQAIEDVINSRSHSAESVVQHIRYVQNEEKKKAWAVQVRLVQASLQPQMRPFITHPIVEEWKKQYLPQRYGRVPRFEMLLLRGKSRAGKTMFAQNLFGPERTIVVSCQGLGDSLPSLRHFDRDVHVCIVFDDLSRTSEPMSGGRPSYRMLAWV